ncbi:MAG: DUF302 domain-containing protein [Gammaproteobacteria bacterium]|nr:DUF302 domain-containing protein [Gammaproteobacteria bacterium]
MYYFSSEIPGSPPEVEQQVIAALKQEGFGIMTEINVAATLKAKLDIDKPPYKILGACNPQLANGALEMDPEIGALLPCNVVVRENDKGSVTVTFMDPQAILGLTDNAELAELAGEVRSRLLRVQAALKS